MAVLEVNDVKYVRLYLRGNAIKYVEGIKLEMQENPTIKAKVKDIVCGYTEDSRGDMGFIYLDLYDENTCSGSE